MKKIIPILLCTAVTLLFTGCGGGKKEAQTTAEPGILKVGIVDGNDRFTSNASGAPVGIEAEIAKIVAEKGSYTLQFMFCDNSEALIKGVFNGEYDLGFGRIAETDKRTEGLGLSRGYAKGGLFLVTPRNNYMDCLTPMQSGTLGISVLADPLKDQVKGMDGTVSETYSNLEKLKSDIASGKIPAGLVNEREAVSMIDGSVQAQELIDSPKENYVAVMKKDSALISRVNEAITEYKLSGTQDQAEEQ